MPAMLDAIGRAALAGSAVFVFTVAIIFAAVLATKLMFKIL